MWTKAATVKQEFKQNKMASQNAREPVADNDSLPTLLRQSAQDTPESRAIADVLQGVSDTSAQPEVPKAKKLMSKAVSAAKFSKMAKNDKKADKNAITSSHSGEAKSSAWKSVGRMVGHLGIAKKVSENTKSSSRDPLQQAERVSDAELAELSKIESLLVADYEDIRYAFTVVTADKVCFTENDLRYAVSQHHFQADLMSELNLGPDHIKLGDVPQLFAALCKLLKYDQGAIPKNIFCMFPERLRFERLQRARFARTGVLRAGETPLDGARLLQLLSKGAKTPEAAAKLLNQACAAMQLQPEATANALLKSKKTHGGPNAGIRFVVSLIRQHGAPYSGIGLDILISGWAICGALAKSAVALGTLASSDEHSHHHERKARAMIKATGVMGALSASAMRLRRRLQGMAGSHHDEAHHDEQSEGDSIPKKKLGVVTKVSLFGARLARKLIRKRKYVRKVGPSPEEDEENHAHLWQILPPGEVLHCLRLGATALDGDDFKQLLQTAWSLFEECDAVTWMIEPKARSDSRAVELLAVQEALAKVVTVDMKNSHTEDAEPMHQQLLGSYSVVQRLRELCDDADDGLLRRAALYGLPILLERVSKFLHASVDLITDPAIAKPSRAATHEMDSVVAKVLKAFTPYEVAVEDGLGYQVPNHSGDAFLSSRGSQSGGAAVVCEEAWKRFLRSKENVQRSQSDAKTEETRDHALASSGRFCTHKLLRHGF